MAVTKRDSLKTFEIFDRFFGRYPEMFHRPIMLWPESLDETLRVEEYRENGTLVIRAELPGIDPAKDLDITVSDGTLRISAERRQEDIAETKDYYRHELRYGTFARELAIPEGASEDDVQAVYKDGMLEVRVPVTDPVPPASPRKVVVKTK